MALIPRLYNTSIKKMSMDLITTPIQNWCIPSLYNLNFLVSLMKKSLWWSFFWWWRWPCRLQRREDVVNLLHLLVSYGQRRKLLAARKSLVSADKQENCARVQPGQSWTSFYLSVLLLKDTFCFEKRAKCGCNWLLTVNSRIYTVELPGQINTDKTVK